MIPEAATHPDCWPTIGYGTLPLRRILVVQTQRLGDVLCATPLYAALRRQFPRSYLAALVRAPQDEVLRGNPDLDEVIVWDERGRHRSLWNRLQFIGELKDRGFDWALVLHADSWTAFALWQAAVKWRTAVWRYGKSQPPRWARMYHQHLYQDRAQGIRHEIRHNLDLLTELGMDARDDSYRVYLRPEERHWAQSFLAQHGRRPDLSLAILHPGHGGGRQEWPAERYAEVGDALVQRGWQVAVTGSDREADLVRRVAEAMRQPSLALAGGLNLRQFAAVLAEARLFVSVSTGPMHLASASGVPAVTLYGPSDLAIEVTRFSPCGSAGEPVRSPVTCPCPGSRDCANPVCMTAISPAMVLEAVDRLAQRSTPAGSL